MTEGVIKPSPPSDDLLEALNKLDEDKRNFERLEELVKLLEKVELEMPPVEPPRQPSPEVQFSFDLSEPADYTRRTAPPVIALDNKTVENLQRRVRPGLQELARYGYSEPLSDPFGLDLRSELRKLVRSV